MTHPDDWYLNVRRFLRYLESSRLPLDQVAPRFGFHPETARGIEERARQVARLRTRNGTSRHRLRKFEYEAQSEASAEVDSYRVLPRCPTKESDLQILRQFSVRILDLTSDSERSGLLQPGLQAYVETVWSSRSYPVFDYDRLHGQDARSFVDLLKALEVRLKAIRFISFDPSLRSEWPNKWREALRISDKIKIEKRKGLFFGREDTRSWLEIRPTFSVSEEAEGNGAGIFGFRYAMVMAFIAFGPDVQAKTQIETRIVQ